MVLISLLTTTTSNEKKVQFFEIDKTREIFSELKESYLKSKPPEKITSVTNVIILLVLHITSTFQEQSQGNKIKALTGCCCYKQY